jgi:outer membrane protein assembly factor BamB
MMKTIRFLLMNAALLLMITQYGTAQTLTGTEYPMDKGGPFDLVYYPENLPDKSDAKYFPQQWHHSYANQRHNAAFEVAADAPGWIKNGVSWRFAEARAWPLENDRPFAEEVNGEARALTTQTQWYGNALGVTPVDGIVYAESDDFFAYAINAKTGKLIWRTSPIGNNLMGNPLVVDDLVYMSLGSVGFNFSNVQAYAKTGEAVRGAGVMYNGIYALDRMNGKLKWYFLTHGEAMPTPAYYQGNLYISTGNGMVYAIDAKTGQKVWETEVGGIANMSSPAVEDGIVYVAMSVKAFIYALDAKTGKVIWKETIPEAANTGMGDVSPVVSNGIVVMDAVNNEKEKDGKKTMDTGVRAYDAKTGKVLWTKQMGVGPKPPAFKGGMPMIHEDVVYIGTPVNNVIKAYNLKTGDELWTWNIPDAGAAGAGRAPATWYKGTLYVSTGMSIYALNPETGKLIGSKKIGGRFGIVNPAIVGGTIYLGNSWDWVIAVPITEVNPDYKP